jgi:hypothetical protein
MFMSTPSQRFNFDAMLALPHGTVIDAIPAGERAAYYLRGASVGALALNVAFGVNRINPRDDLYMHVAVEPTAESHRYAYQHAEALATQGVYPDHMSREELAQLAAIAGRPYLATTPGIVYGLPRGNHELVTHPSSFQPVVAGEVPLSGLDPHSQAALSELFGMDVATLPIIPGATRPLPEIQIDVF